MMAAPTTRWVNHLWSAGTTNQEIWALRSRRSHPGRRIDSRPSTTFRQIGGAEFPVLLRLVEPRQKSCLLLPLRKMKEELQNHGALSREMTLKVGDKFVLVFPHLLADEVLGQVLVRQQLRMHPDDEHLFVIAAVEYADAPTLRQNTPATP